MQIWGNWDSYWINIFMVEMEPERLIMDYIDHKKEFGDEFTLRELLIFQQLKAGAFLVVAIANVPEQLRDQSVFLINSIMPTLSKIMFQTADLLEEKWNEKWGRS